MRKNTLLTVGVALALGAGIYYLLTRERKRTPLPPNDDGVALDGSFKIAGAPSDPLDPASPKKWELSFVGTLRNEGSKTYKNYAWELIVLLGNAVVADETGGGNLVLLPSTALTLLAAVKLNEPRALTASIIVRDAAGRVFASKTARVSSS